MWLRINLSESKRFKTSISPSKHLEPCVECGLWVSGIVGDFAFAEFSISSQSAQSLRFFQSSQFIECEVFEILVNFPFGQVSKPPDIVIFVLCIYVYSKGKAIDCSFGNGRHFNWSPPT